VVGRGEKADLRLAVGEHMITLTVQDSGGFYSSETTTMTVLPFGYPDIVSLSPEFGPLQGGYEVTINGFGFTTASQLIVHFGLTDLTGNDLTVVDENTIKVTAPLETVAVPVRVSVESIPLNATSNSATFNYEAGVPIKFKSRLLMPFDVVTVAKFGPDGKLYVATGNGYLSRVTLDDNFNVMTTVTSAVALFRVILGITFDPLSAGDLFPPVYCTSSFLFHGESRSTTGHAIGGRVYRVSGANLDSKQIVISGLPVADMDHANNNIEFGDNGEIYIQCGSNTNGGIPGPLTGSQIMKENFFSAATVVAYMGRPNFDGNITYSALDDGEPDLTKGVEVFAAGERNPFGIVLHSNGYLYATDNGPNLSYVSAQILSSSSSNWNFLTNQSSISILSG